ncbi:MAG: hypothetical protein II767_10675 [Proteobacteria bacterium]|nr:hypothetical protein [Pseudomonadota bacterium]
MKKTSLIPLILWGLTAFAGCSDEPETPQCTPMCDGLQCGPDGCGGACGKCDATQTVCMNGLCLIPPCIPNCVQRICGDDGCGGTCGFCPTGMYCFNGSCAQIPPSCKPDCTGKTCGDDGCGGSCGTCPAEQSCTDGVCLGCRPYCNGRVCGSDGCGGTCGTCPDKASCNDSTGQCMPYRVKGRLLLEVQTVYYDAYQLPKFDKKVDITGQNIPISLRDASGKEIASTVVNTDGTFEMQLSRLPVSTDWLSIVPVWYVGGKMKLAVLKAALNTPYDIWEWTIRLSNYASKDDPGDMGDIRVTIDQASAGLYLYQQLYNAYQDMVNTGFILSLEDAPSLGAVWNNGIKWSCGTCLLPLSVEAGKTQLKNQMLVSGEKGNEGPWGYPTILHEFGHYILFQRRDDTDGESHIISHKSSPKLAWSEGWATFYALMVQSLRSNTPITQYWRVLPNASYWYDIAHLYDNSQTGSIIVPEPSLTDGSAMRQDLCEAWVTYMIWDFWDGLEVADPTVPPDKVKFRAKDIYNALDSDRYKNLQYYEPKTSGRRTDYGTDFVDFVDALICGAYKSGNSQAASDIMDLLIERKFPYDRTPVCDRT